MIKNQMFQLNPLVLMNQNQEEWLVSILILILYLGN